MNSVHIDIRLEGDNFLPSKFVQISNIPLEVIAEAGEIADRGRFKGKPSPYGLALWNVSTYEGGDILRVLSEKLNTLLKFKKEFAEVGIEEVIVDIDAPKEISLDNDLLSLIAQLNAKVDFNVNSDEEIDQAIRQIVEFIDKRIETDEHAKAVLYSERANKLIKTLLGEDPSEVKKNKFRTIRYLLFYLYKSENDKSVELSNIEEVLK